MREMGIQAIYPGPNLSKRNRAQYVYPMDGKGRALDNAITERFWRTIKWEDIYLKQYETPRELRKGINTYIHYYNYERRHSSLDDRRPMEAKFSGRLKVECCKLIV